MWKDKPNVLHKPITNQWDGLRRVRLILGILKEIFLKGKFVILLFFSMQACRNFIKWNFELVANTNDFGNFQPDVLATLLQQNDLVVQSEMVLYK